MNGKEAAFLGAVLLAGLVAAAGMSLSAISNPHGLVAFLGFEIPLMVGAAGLLLGPVRRQRVLFSIMCLCISGYSLLLFGQYVCVSADQVVALALTAGIGYICLPAAGMHFSFEFFGLRTARHKAAIACAWSASALFYLFMAAGIMPLEYERTGVKFALRMSPAYAAQLASHAAFMCLVFAELLISLIRKAPGLKRTQLSWFLFASLAAMLLGYTNPLHTLGFPAYPMGGLALAMLSSVLAYLMVKHRFLDVELVLRRTFFWVLWTSGVALVYTGTLAGFSLLLGRMQLDWSLPDIAALMAAAVAILPLRDIVQNLVDKRFFRRSFDSRMTLEELSGRVLQIMNVKDLSREVLETVVSTFSAEGGYILLAGVDGGFWLAAAKEDGGSFEYLAEEERTAVTASGAWCAGPRRFDQQADLPPDLPSDAAAFVRDRRVEACLPLKARGGAAGMLMMGAKKSELAYTDFDMHLLVTIANHAAVAFTNANLYEQVLSAKNFTENIVSSLQGGLITVDPHLRMTSANEQARMLLGVESGAECGGQEKCPGALEKRLAALFSGAHGVTAEQVRLDGKILSLSTSPIIDRRGKVAGALASILDVTEREQMRASMERQGRLAMIGEMASKISHEIGNPLGYIQLTLGLIQRKQDDVEFRSEKLALVLDEIRRLGDIATGLKDFSRRVEPKKVPLDLGLLVGSCLDVMSGKFEADGIRLARRVDQGIPKVLLDGDQFKQVIVNLVKNAAEAASESRAREVVVSAGTRTGGFAFLAVEDSGPGIPEDVLPQIFMPFFSTKAKGSGLGLAMVSKIVEANGCSISADSIPGTGARFVVDIPLAEAAGGASAEQYAAHPEYSKSG